MVKTALRLEIAAAFFALAALSAARAAEPGTETLANGLGAFFAVQNPSLEWRR